MHNHGVLTPELLADFLVFKKFFEGGLGSFSFKGEVIRENLQKWVGKGDSAWIELYTCSFVISYSQFSKIIWMHHFDFAMICL